MKEHWIKPSSREAASRCKQVIAMETCKKKSSGELHFTEGGFLFDPSSGLTFTLNKTAAFIFDKLRREESEQSIIEELIKKFKVEENTARQDLSEFTKQLKEFRLIGRGQK